MSRIGNLPIAVPQGVDVKITGQDVEVKGQNGTLHFSVDPDLTIAREGDEIVITRPTDDKRNRSMHGLTRSLIANMITGVTEGYKKALEIQGVGYRAAKEGNELVLNLGYSHQVRMPEIDGITIEVPSQTSIIISGPDKQKVGHFAAEVRSKRPPEPYKGKGIRYVGEYVARKEGKAGKA